jgi:hypothetical protein
MSGQITDKILKTMNYFIKNKYNITELAVIVIVPLIWWIMNGSFNQRMSQEDLVDQIVIALLILILIRRNKNNNFFGYAFIALILTAIAYTFYNLKISLFFSSLTIGFMALGVIKLLFFQRINKE